jgi:probable addiction module antidote protein
MNMSEKFIDYQDELIKSLKDPEEAVAYLNAALMDEDERVFLLALKDVLEAQGGNISQLAKDTQLNRENLYRILSIKGNPKLTSIKSILNSLDLELAVQPVKTKH